MNLKLRFAVMIYQEGSLWFASIKDKETDITLKTKEMGYYSFENLMSEINELINLHRGVNTNENP